MIEVQVGAVERLGQILCFDLLPLSGILPPWQAGAHIDLILEDGLLRQYSLCGDPADRTRYQLAVLREPDSRGGSHAVHDHVKPGARFRVGTPRNLFPLARGARHSLLIGGGIGVTPLVAMAHELHARGEAFTFHYVARDPVFAELLAAAPFAGQVRVYDRSSMQTPRFDPHQAVASAGAAAGKHVYVCGPVGLMDAVTEAARDAGLADDQIHQEAFSAVPVTGGDGFEVLAAKSGVRVQVAADETITAALARVGVKVTVSCEQGICGTCVVNLLEGEPDHRDEYLTEEERTDQIALCCSRARSPLLVIDL
ncbi:PDR/VanB family oxidoreductase [Nguyenibacter vanlangensis]|uniref:PDR/VanB family oxidoreductase n=1 Tax=Nguyenibacter vanlangensis TaxID=1216886 RepID=A0ABZ3DA88_9PROT